MLLLQLKDRLALKLHKKTLFFSILGFVSFSLHLFLIVFIFLIPDEKKRIFLDTRTVNNATILFVPFLKQAPATALDLPTTNLCAQKIQQTTTQLKNSAVPIPVIKKTAQPKKAPIKKIMPIKKVQPKKVVQKRQELPKKAPAKPLEQKKIINEQKKQTTIKEKKSSLIEPKTAHENIRIVGSAELEMIEVTSNIKEDILKQWKRPATIALDDACTATIILDKEGNKKIIIDKPSRAPLFDIQVRNFLLSYEFPKQLFAHELTILF